MRKFLKKIEPNRSDTPRYTSDLIKVLEQAPATDTKLDFTTNVETAVPGLEVEPQEKSVLLYLIS